MDVGVVSLRGAAGHIAATRMTVASEAFVEVVLLAIVAVNEPFVAVYTVLATSASPKRGLHFVTYCMNTFQ